MAEVITIPITIQTTKAIKDIRRFSKSATKALGSIASVATDLRSVLAAVVIGLGFKRLIDESIALENALIGLSSVARNTGQNVDKVTDAAKELAADGLIPLTEVSTALKNLLAAGLDTGETIKLFKALRDAASFGRQGQLGLGEAIVGATQGFKNQLSILIDNAGITKNLSVLQKEYAESIGTTIGKLTQAQKKQANYTGILREAAIFQGDYNKLQNTFSGATSEVTGRIKFLLAELGNLITRNPVVIKQVKNMAKFFKELTANIKTNASVIQKDLIPVFEALGAVVDLIKPLVDLIIDVIKFINVLGKSLGLLAAQIVEVVDGFSDLEAEFQIIIRTIKVKFLGAIDAVIGKIEDLFNALESIALVKGIFVKAADGAKFFRDKIKESVDAAKKDIEIFETFLGAEVFRNLAPKIEPQIKADIKTQVKPIIETDIFRILLDDLKKNLGQVTTSFVTALKGGTAGAVSGFQQISAIVTEKLLPGFGKTAAAIVGFLAQGPEKVKETVTAFISAIPGIIENIILAIPALVEALIIGLIELVPRLIERIPEIIEAFILSLVDAIPRIVEAFAEAMPRVAVALAFNMPTVAISLAKSMPRVAIEFSKSLVKEIPNMAKEFVQALVDEIKGAFEGIATGVSDVGSFLGFQQGGDVPSGFPNDSLLAGLSSGERVLTAGSTRTLDSFLNSQTGQVSNNEILRSLQDVIRGSQGGSQNLSVELRIGEEQLANAMLNINKDGLRTA